MILSLGFFFVARLVKIDMVALLWPSISYSKIVHRPYMKCRYWSEDVNTCSPFILEETRYDVDEMFILGRCFGASK